MLTALFVALQFPAQAIPSVTVVDPKLTELRLAFNKAERKTRVLIMTSPTCPMCIEGVKKMQADVFAKVKDSNLRIFVLWMRVLDPDSPDEAKFASQFVPDRRAKFFWDDARYAGDIFKSVIPLPADRRFVWDTFMLYDAKAKWKSNGPPKPAFWMYQLAKDEHFLETGKFRAEVEKVIRSGSKRDLFRLCVP